MVLPFRGGSEIYSPKAAKVGFLTQSCLFHEGLEKTQMGSLLAKVRCNWMAYTPLSVSP